MYGADFTDTTGIITTQVNQHQVFGEFLRIGQQIFFELQIFGFILAALVVTYRMDQIIAGVVINLFALGLTGFLRSEVIVPTVPITPTRPRRVAWSVARTPGSITPMTGTGSWSRNWCNATPHC